MTPHHDPIAAQVEHLRRLARLAVVFNGCHRAQMIWARHHRRALGDLPTSYVSTTDGMYDIEGLIIQGTWDVDHGWDLDGTFLLLVEDGEILTVHGWMASETEIL